MVEEKNRRTALMNRLRTVIRCEEKAEERAYLALGRYYYHNLRDAENTVTEPYCIDIEAAQKRIDAAVEKLEALTREGDSEAEERRSPLMTCRSTLPRRKRKRKPKKPHSCGRYRRTKPWKRQNLPPSSRKRLSRKRRKRRSSLRIMRFNMNVKRRT